MNLVAALAVALLALAALLPPEIHPAGRLMAHLVAAASALALSFYGWPLSPRARRAALLLLPLPLASLILVSGGRARGLDEAAAFAGFGLAVLLGRRLAEREDAGRRWVIAAVAVLGTLAAAQAIVQHHWAYPRTAAALRAAGEGSGLAWDVDAGAYLVRLDQGRPAGPFSLPAALGGFLALSLPMTLAARQGAARAAARFGATAAIGAQAYALLLTRSLGGLFAASVALGMMAARARPERRWRMIAAAAIAFAAIATLFVHARRAEIGARPGGDPITLRLGNWEAAARMIEAHPILGVGPGRFPVFYPRFLQPGMNETQYAHNSYLQIAATWGTWALLPLGLLMAAALRRTGRGDGSAAQAAGIGFLAHNVLDFTFFLPGVALPAGLLLGFAAPSGPAGAPGSGPERSAARLRSGPRPGRIAGAVLAAILLTHALTSDRAALHLDRARTRALAGETEAAERDALKAARAFPLDPDPWAFVAQSLLARGATDDASATLRRTAADRAARLEPESAILHHTRALDRAATGDLAAAWIDERRAAQLYPAKELYRAAPKAPEAGP